MRKQFNDANAGGGDAAIHIVLDNTSLQHSRGQNITMEAQFEQMFISYGLHVLR